jgi:hypothetical protein
MKWWKNQILLGICTVVGGIAAIGYFSEKVAAILPSRSNPATSVGLEWWEILIGVVIVLVPYILIHYILIKSRKELKEKAETKAGWGPVAEHYTNGSGYWQIGLTGFLVRLRGQVVIVILTFILLCYVKWIWPNLNFLHSSYTFNLSASHLVTYAVPILISLYLIKSTIKRFKFIKETEEKSLIRALSDTFHCDISQNDKPSISFESFCNKVCNIVSLYFRISINEPSVHCVMKVALSEEHGDISYKVVGSSQNTYSMKAISNSISSSDGIAKFFLHKDVQGILIIRNISAAAELGIISKAEVENLWRVFKVNSLMVSPLVWCQKNSSVILGFIYLTSENNIFNAHHVDNLIRISESISPNLNRIAEQLHARAEINPNRWDKAKSL